MSQPIEVGDVVVNVFVVVVVGCGCLLIVLFLLCVVVIVVVVVNIVGAVVNDVINIDHGNQTVQYSQNQVSKS